MGFDETEAHEFKVLLVKSIQFLIVFVVIDLTLGFLAKEIFFSQKTGKYARLTYSIEKDSADILIMGSSHAVRHYIPEVFEKKMGVTCYNAGVQGQQIIFQTALQKMILKRHKPKLIILNVDRNWMFESNEAYERLADLYPYYWDFRPELDSILSLNSKYHTVKLLFSSYQTNSTIVHAIKYFILPQKDFKGYLPLYEKMEKLNAPEKVKRNQKIDPNFVNLFKEFIENARKNDIDLIIAISPILTQERAMESYHSIEKMKSIAVKYNIPLIDLSSDSNFVGRLQLFNDSAHLNDDGATLFSNLLVSKLDSIF